jgi:4-amino-4-deoxy-L-arabinose transferase-like glycosyltransferase
MLVKMRFLSAVRPWLVLTLVLVVAACGLLTTPLWKQHLWEPVGTKNFIYFALICCVLGALSVWRAPQLTRAHLLLLTLAASVALVGPGPVGVVSFLLAGCAALGDAVAGLLYRLQGERRPQGAMDSMAVARSAFTGLAIYVTFLALTAPFRIHYVAVWGLLLAVPLVLNRGYLKQLAGFAARAFAPVPAATRAAALTMVVLGIGLLAHLVLIPKPEASADGLAMHLALPVRLAANHFFAYDPGAFLWSLMPMAGTFSFAIAYMLGGEAAARLLDFALLGLIVLLQVRILRRWAPDWVAWLVAGVFVSTPLVQFVTTSLMIENAQTGFLLAAFACVLNARKNRARIEAGEDEEAGGARSMEALLAGLLAGAALASKFGSLAIAVPLVVMAAIAVPRRALAVAALFLAFGLPPYVNAWARTGNPLFPFLGNVFPSQYSNASWYVKDLRWTETLSWRTLYDLTFHSSRFYENQDGGFGFQSLMLLPLALAIPYRRWPQAARAPFWLAVAAALAALWSVPHLRYLYPPLAFSALALAIPLVLGAPRFRQAAVACAGLVWILNLLFLPSSNSYHRDFLLNPFRADAARVYQRDMAPLDPLANYVNLVQPGAAVATLDCEVSGIAYFTGMTYMNNWHSGKGRVALGLAKSEDDILSFARKNGVHWFAGCRTDATEANPDSVAQRFLRRYTTDVFTSGAERLARLRPEFEFARELLVNNDFQAGFSDWVNRENAVFVPSEHAVQVTERKNLNQRVPAEPNGTYRVTIRARCLEPDTFTRLQVNWLDRKNHVLSVSLLPVRCTPEWNDYSEVFTAPLDARAGFFSVTGHTPKPVLVQRVSMAH